MALWSTELLQESREGLFPETCLIFLAVLFHAVMANTFHYEWGEKRA